MSTAVHAPREPFRMCIACRRREPQSQLLRLAVLRADDDRIVVDTDRRLPGRGAWIHDSAACWKRARAKRAFSTALRAPGLPGPEAAPDGIGTTGSR